MSKWISKSLKLDVVGYGIFVALNLRYPIMWLWRSDAGGCLTRYETSLAMCLMATVRLGAL